MKIYTLITHHTDAAPDMEHFSELPTMDFTNPYGDTHELYEGYLDGGDTRPISILHCDGLDGCGGTYAVRSMRVIDKRDPTEFYKLTCGHETMGC